MLEATPARRSDPTTSHAAAASVSGVRRSQEAVHGVLREHGPMTDSKLLEAYDHAHADRPTEYPQQSESGIRTRRRELVDLGWIVDTGERERLPSGRQSIVWRAIYRQPPRQAPRHREASEPTGLFDPKAGAPRRPSFMDPD